jgi:hypothetical protein
MASGKVLRGNGPANTILNLGAAGVEFNGGTKPLLAAAKTITGGLAKGSTTQACCCERGSRASTRTGSSAGCSPCSRGTCRFYQRYGFEIAVEGDVPDGGPHFWFMRRGPHAIRP